MKNRRSSTGAKHWEITLLNPGAKRWEITLLNPGEALGDNSARRAKGGNYKLCVE